MKEVELFMIRIGNQHFEIPEVLIVGEILPVATFVKRLWAGDLTA